MALVRNIRRDNEKRHGAQGEVECFASNFIDVEGKHYLQLDTTGSPSREVKGAINQSLRLDEKAARQLKLLIEEIFPTVSKNV
jgi:hypothetical protein